jgi:hypothetical protein
MTDGDDFEIKKPLVGYIIIILITVFLYMQLQALSLEENVSQGYVSFYLGYATLGIITAIMSIVLYAIVRIRWGSIIQHWWVKLALSIVFIFYIVMLTTGSGQIIDVPRASQVELQLTPATELYTSSVIPAILEDWIILWIFPFIIFIGIGLVLENGLGIEIDAENHVLRYVGVGVTACLIASVGVNVWLIPGFVSQHVPAYGGQTDAYTGAFLFALPQSILYFFTGWFLPVAHGIHNFIVTYGSLYQIIGGPFMIGGI